MSFAYILGIDFGDQFCKVALAKVMPDGRFDELDVSYLHPLVPSLILFKDDGTVDFGVEAQAANAPATIGSLKRLLTLAGGDPPADINAVFPFVLGKTEKGEIGVKVGSAEEQHVISVIEVLAVFFRQIVNLASSLVNDNIDKVVITVPDWFDNTQLGFMSSVCKMADLPLVGLIPESAAAHIYYTMSQMRPFAAEVSHLVVFIDVGHMATVVSILSHVNGKPAATTTLLDTTFGGHNIDLGILSKLGASISAIFDSHIEALVECRKVKEGLLDLNMSFPIGSSEMSFNGQELYKLNMSLHHISDLVKEALSKAGFELDQVQKVVITGGSAHMLQIQDCICSMFPPGLVKTSFDMLNAKGCLYACSTLSDSGFFIFKHDAELKILNEAIEQLWNQLNVSSAIVSTVEGFGDAFHAYSLKKENEIIHLLGSATIGSTLDDLLLSQSRLAESLPVNHSDKPMYLDKLANSLVKKFEITHQIVDIAKAALIEAEAVALSINMPVIAAKYLNNLVHFLHKQYNLQKDLNILKQAITCVQTAQKLTQNDKASQIKYFGNLSSLLHTKYMQTHDVKDLNASVIARKSAIDFLEKNDSSEGSHLLMYGLLLENQFDIQKDVAILNTGVNAFERALELALERPIEIMCSFNLGVLLQKRYDKISEISDLDKSILHQSNAVNLSLDDHPQKAMYLNHLGGSLGNIFKKRWIVNDLKRSIECYQSAVTLSRSNSASKPVYLNNLGKALGTYFTHQKSISHLNDAVIAQQEAVNMTLDSHSNKNMYLRNFAMLLEARYSATSDLQDLNQAIIMRQKALSLSSFSKYPHLSSLAEALTQRYRALQDINDLNEIISVRRKVIAMIPDFMPDKVMYLDDLAKSLWEHYKCTQTFSSLKDVISVQKTIVALADKNDSKASSHWLNLAKSYRELFDARGHIDDLQEAILLYEQTFSKLQLSDQVDCLNHLGCAYYDIFMHFNDMSKLLQSIQTLKKAIEAAPDDETKISCSNNLAMSLLAQFDQLENISDLREAVQLYKNIVALTSDTNSVKSARLNNLRVSLHSLFEYENQIEDLNEAIKAGEAAISLQSDNIDLKFKYQAGLGTCLVSRFEQTHAIQDLDKAIAYQQNAIDHIAESDPSKSVFYTSLGSTYQTRFIEYGELYDLNQAIYYQKKAVDIIPSNHINRPMMLNNLSNSLRSLFYNQQNMKVLNDAQKYQELAIASTVDTHKNMGLYMLNLASTLSVQYQVNKQIDHLDNCISYLERSLSVTSDSDPLKITILLELGDALCQRGQQTGQISDLDSAIIYLQNVVNITPDLYSVKAKQYSCLGQAYIATFKLSKDSKNLEKAIAAYKQASIHKTGSFTVCFQAAYLWIQCATQYADLSLKLAYATALDILPHLAWLGLSVENQLSRLIRANTIGCDAAATALQIENEATKLDLAIEWLEQGRSITWKKILQLRSPYTALAAIDPALSKKIHDLSTELNNHRALGSSLYITGMKQNPLMIRYVFENQHKLASELDQLLKKVQQNPETRDLFQNMKATEYKNAASYGPIIVLNISQVHCDALIIQKSPLPSLHLSLDHISYQDIEKMQKHLKELLSLQYGPQKNSQPERYGRPANKMMFKDADAMFRQILEELWFKIVRPIIDVLQLLPQLNSQKLPHIYWCPTGPLTFLPLHAAGVYTSQTDSSDYLESYAISSYIPNLTTLYTILERRKQSKNVSVKMLAIVQSETPGHSSLPGAHKELQIISNHAGSSLQQVISGVQATKEAVLENLSEYSWIHFSCHGLQDIENPAYSGFALQNGLLMLLDLINKPLPNAEFAFLSACQTASGDNKQPDEAIHLAAGFLLAGFSSVIATMWSVRDNDAPDVADQVYHHLIHEKEHNIEYAAEALHLAVKKLRIKHNNSSFGSWVPWIHMGM